MSIWTIFYNIYAIPGNFSELVSALILSFSFEKRGLAARSDKNVEFTVVLIKIIKYEDNMRQNSLVSIFIAISLHQWCINLLKKFF